ncbi:TSUP family transporter [Bradyrhizobium sp. RP6]|uniref:TSUP family transporter n=1 Tax=Bradyrhizobium sp. RP6 TaxID=2489596 RepID=UPI0024BFD0B3|nr:TSUP family transporter [Bradyrhizobium sp. RP6]
MRSLPLRQHLDVAHRPSSPLQHFGVHLAADIGSSVDHLWGLHSAEADPAVREKSPVGTHHGCALGGITGGLAAFPAAFVSMWCHVQGFDKHRARAIIQPFILVNQLLSLSLLMVLRPSEVMPLGLLFYAAPAVLGAYVGLMIFNRVDTATFNRLVGLLLMAAGIGFVRPL